ncbi:MAG: hypothetical protein FJX35_04615, partial [Alphaproteobacteria bacterium]|nr:hypothetical protein [Alphaproteobacteria bacterium]
MMSSQELLDTISDYCRRARLAESTFGRLAANDGKLVGRLRDGGRIKLRTLERLQTYMSSHPTPAQPPEHSVLRRPRNGATGAMPARIAGPELRPAQGATDDRSFRFFDNRQKYLLFVHTCSEKQVVAERVAMELAHIHPRPPAVRMFDAGVGDGSVLSRVMRAMHNRFPTMPFYIVGKEISLEDVRLALEKMPDRFYEHPATVLVMTNLNYAEAPWLAPGSIAAATTLVWHECVLTGATSHEFEEQITDLAGFLGENWRAHLSPRTGNPVYERPIVLVIYRADQRFLLDRVIPRP